MNPLGIGPLELVVVLLVAFIALGPGKTMEVARTIGRVVREARRTFTDVMDAASITSDDVNRRTTSQTPGPTVPPDDDPPPAPVRPPDDPIPSPPHLRAQNPPPDDAEAGPGPDADRRQS